MKHTTSIIKLFSLALFVLVGTACIDNFDKINQKDYQVDKEELGREGYNVGASLKGLQGLVIPTEEHLYQFVEALAAGASPDISAVLWSGQPNLRHTIRQQTGRKHLSLILSHVLTRSIVTCSTKQKIRSH